MAVKALVLFDFTAEPGNNELSVKEGETVTVIDETAGGGWIEAQNSGGQTGFVPEGYLQLADCGSGGAGRGESRHRAARDDDGDDDDDDDGEWDEEWDDPYRYDCQNDEGSAAGHRPQSSSRKILLNKFPFSKSPSPEVYLLAKAPANGSKKLPIYMGEVGPVWLYPTDPLECVIADPRKESKLYGLKSYIEYQLTPSVTDRAVNHRYKHFDWLHVRLLEKFGSVMPIPSLPDKQVTGRFDEDFIRMRMERLQAWMNRMCRHPIVSQSDVFQRFLTYNDEKEWKAGKREAEKDETVGPLVFCLVEPEAPEQEASHVELCCERYSCFTKSMDECVRELISIGHTHWKRCTGTLPKEYQQIGRAFGNLSALFNSSGYPGEETLTDALTVAGKTFEDIADIVAQQPKKDLHFLMETNREYKGLLGCFPEIFAVHKAAVEKLKDADNLIDAGKISNSDKKTMKHRVSCMNYALQAEMNHFHSNRIYDYNRVMQLYLQQQVTFYQQIAEKLQNALNQFTTL